MNDTKYKISNDFWNNISEIPEKLQSKCLREISDALKKYADKMDSENIRLSSDTINKYMTWTDDDCESVTDVNGDIVMLGNK